MQYHIIDVFTDKLFGGNPAGVCLLEQWLPDGMMQSIATENNLSETAFLVKQDGYYDLRWFTPSLEVDLCGHATVASAYVLFDDIEKDSAEIKFKTLSGILTASIDRSREDGLVYINLPARPVTPCPVYQSFKDAFGIEPVAAFKAADFLVLLDSEEAVQNLAPDFTAYRRLKAEAGLDTDDFGTIVTARGRECDFVSRYFAPDAGVDEDPVTGRAHCSLIPYWSGELGKTVMSARQLSKRGGALYCEDMGERVKIGGRLTRYLKGELFI